MKQNIENAIAWIKDQDKEGIKGCITGSTVLDEYWEGMDIDVFLYSEKSFTGLFYAMYHNPMFTMLDPLEKWKSDKFRTEDSDYYKKGIQTVKFYYNTCIEVNIILKRNCVDIFSVLASFDMDIISLGYDIQTKQELDLGNKSLRGYKVATWNKWNTSFYSPELWRVSRLLRQLSRCFKYHKRGYNTDNVVAKYIELINGVQKIQNIFNSDSFSEKLKISKENTRVVKQICETWLEKHELSKEEEELIQIKIKEI